MLTIRSEQMNLLAAQQRFEKVLRHVKKFFPKECSKFSTGDLERVIRSAMRRANAHGFTALRDLLQFADLTVVFGADFDRRYLWAREVLEDGAGERACFRSALLYRRAQEQLRETR